METLTLTRTKKEFDGVYGTFDIPCGNDIIRVATIENARYLIPDGEYPIRITWSPKFQKRMPEIMNVPERSGIRIHAGSEPEHSKGCICVSKWALSFVLNYLNHQIVTNEDEEAVHLVITSTC